MPGSKLACKVKRESVVGVSFMLDVPLRFNILCHLAHHVVDTLKRQLNGPLNLLRVALFLSAGVVRIELPNRSLKLPHGSLTSVFVTHHSPSAALVRASSSSS